MIRKSPDINNFHLPASLAFFSLLALAHSFLLFECRQATAGILYWDSGRPGEPQNPLSEGKETRPLSSRPLTFPTNELTKSPVIDQLGLAISNEERSSPTSVDDEENNSTSAGKNPIASRAVAYDPSAFRSDPIYANEPYNPEDQTLIYGGKTEVPAQRPLPELGRPFYQVGPIGHGLNLVGEKNLLFPHFYGFGDWRTAVAFNDNGGDERAQVATRLNLDIDLGLTATERLHALFQPLQEDGAFTRCEFAGDDSLQDCEFELTPEPQTLFFEGDLGAITAGITDHYQRWELPVTAGLVPLLFQNGIWVEDAFLGGALSFPALNSSALDISNADITVFGGFDQVNANGVTDANGNIANSNVNLYGIATFIEAREGYIEAGYGYVDAEDSLSDQDYHSATMALTRRYGGKISNSLRLVGSFGQSRDRGEDQNGLVILAENSLITSKPYQFVPYGNFFVGIERPVPLARQDGILKNTGIAFESDALTGFPFLNDTGQNAYGGAVGIQHLFDLDQQIVVEAAAVRNLEDVSTHFEEVVGNQYAVSARYQIPLSNAWIFRSDVIYSLRESEEDVAGVRTELRFKF